MNVSKLKNINKKKVLFYGFLCFIALFSITIYIKQSVRHLVFDNIKNIEKKEFAIVLGAAIKDKKPGNYLQYRLDDAIDLYNAEKIKRILLSGDNGNKAHDEISVMNNYLIEKGIPQDKIFGDYAGFDTYSSMERAEKVFEIKDAIIVSQGFHLPRAIYIAKQKGINATGYATKQSYGKNKYFIRENLALIKSFFDCLIHRKAKYYGNKVNAKGNSNINIDQ